MGITERKEREKQQRREEIIRAAEDVFFTKGIDLATMDDVAERAELSKGTLYLYFRNKEDLYVAVAQSAIDLLRRSMDGIEDGPDPALDKLQAMGRQTVRFARSHPNHMKAILLLEGFEVKQSGVTIHDVKEAILRDSPVGLLIRILEQGISEGLIRRDIPATLLAHTLWMQTISVIRFVYGRADILESLELKTDQVFEIHLELLLHGIRA
ncbi:MAG: TetR/AcrR family transcriptional regulator [Bacteroidales bacterium]